MNTDDGTTIPTLTPEQAEELAMWRAYAARLGGRTPGRALTKAEHDALMVGRDRPLTQQAIDRHRKGEGHNLLGEFT